jgi:ferredoxin-NADP reductase
MILRQHATIPDFAVIFFSEEPAGEFAQQLAQLPKRPRCLPGRIALDPIWSQLGEPGRKTFYLSGPPVMLSALGADLRRRGIAPERIRTDAWE